MWYLNEANGILCRGFHVKDESQDTIGHVWSHIMHPSHVGKKKILSSRPLPFFLTELCLGNSLSACIYRKGLVLCSGRLHRLLTFSLSEGVTSKRSP